MGSFLSILIAPVRGVFILMTVASVSVIVLATPHRRELPFDPFSPYTDLLLGQSLDAVEQQGFICTSTHAAFSLQQSCSLALGDGTFSEIEVRFASDRGTVNRIVFTPREKMLTVGDLLLLWPKPEIRFYSEMANLRWPHIVAVPQSFRGHFSYWVPIAYVAFEAAD